MKSLLLITLRWSIAVIFIVAGITKILNPFTFAEDIDNYRMLPYLLVTIMAIVMPWLEIFSGIFLVVGKLRQGAIFILLLLNVIFLIAITSAIIRGLDITCGCFAITNEGTKVGITRLIQDILLFVSLIYIYYHESIRVNDIAFGNELVPVLNDKTSEVC